MGIERETVGTSFGALLFRTLPDIVAVFRATEDDADLEIVSVNDVVLEGAGWEPDQVAGMSVGSLLHPVIVDAVMAAYHRLDQVGASERFEVAIEVPAGRRVYDVTMVRLEDHDGVPHCMTINRDVTETRAVSDALEETQSIAHIGHWSWDLVTDVLRFTDEVKRMYGVALDGEALPVEHFWARVHEDDAARVRAEIDRAIDQHRVWQSEYRVHDLGDDIRLVLGQGLAVYDPDGNPIRLAGTVQDITERRATEAVAQKAELVQAQQRQALELNDDVVQGLATVRLALMTGEHDLAMSTLDRTIVSARAIISQLLAAKVEGGGIGPGDMVRDRSARGADAFSDPFSEVVDSDLGSGERP